MAENRYYYNQLDKIHQQVYHSIHLCLTELGQSVQVPRLPMDELSEIYFLIRLDCPEIFYSNTFTCKSYPGSESYELIPEYLYTKKQIADQRQALDSRIKKLLRGTEKLDEKGKEQFVHDFICKNITYDKLKKPYSHEISGVLTNGVGVCEGIAKTVKILCDTLGIKCIIALCDNNPEKGIKYRHTWNLVRIGGNWYHLDATFDNTLSKNGVVRYDYFNVNDDRIFRDHEKLLRPVPVCSDGRHDFYSEKKLAFSKYEDIRKRASQAAKKNRELVFRWNGGYLTREVIQDIFTIISEEAQLKSSHPLLSINPPQAVFQLSFTDAPSESSLVTEDANEGEHYTGE